jgi:hypothetical protein
MSMLSSEWMARVWQAGMALSQQCFSFPVSPHGTVSTSQNPCVFSTTWEVLQWGHSMKRYSFAVDKS